MKFTRQPSFEQSNDDGGIGVLVANLGTPDSCRVGDVRRYLAEFLWDRRVIEVSRVVWWLVLHLVVLPGRPRKTAKAYREIWGEDGSPLLAVSRRQVRELERRLKAHPHSHSHSGGLAVELGMRYGSPSIAGALAKLRSGGARRVLVLPLYPQYCAATTASAFDAVCAELSRWRRVPALRVIDHYHDHPGYIAALANSVRDYRQVHGGSERLLMSFHGIPRAYSDAGDPYHGECLTTARLLAEELELDEREWRVSFQSRFGPKQWLQPYTDHTLADWARDGVRSVQVICPGFSADCLETLEEVAMQNRDIFMRAGGENYGYIPCLNDRDDHIEALADLITDNLAGWDSADRTHASSPANEARDDGGSERVK